jgi:hypothetical protein
MLTEGMTRPRLIEIDGIRSEGVKSTQPPKLDPQLANRPRESRHTFGFVGIAGFESARISSWFSVKIGSAEAAGASNELIRENRLAAEMKLIKRTFFNLDMENRWRFSETLLSK